MDTQKSIPLAIVIAGVMIAGSILYVNRNGIASILPAASPTPVVLKDPGVLLSGRDASMGKEDAKVTIVEFSDFQCPYCRQFFLDTYGQIKKDYVDTGKARLVYRHFPLGFHAAAKPAALATACAKDQGKFWELHDKIFTEQQKQEASPKVVTKTVDFTDADLKTWAGQVGLDMAKFNSCFDSGKYAADIDADAAVGSTYGVTGTPSFFINGELFVGAQPYAVFKAAIEAALR